MLPLSVHCVTFLRQEVGHYSGSSIKNIIFIMSAPATNSLILSSDGDHLENSGSMNIGAKKKTLWLPGSCCL